MTHKHTYPRFLIVALLLASFMVGLFPARAQDPTELSDDFALHEKYALYLNYKKKQKYKKYQEYDKHRKKYKLTDSATRLKYKDGYEKYRLFKKDKVRYRYYEQYYEQYKVYKKFRDLEKKYKKYSKYKKYNKSKYNEGKHYGGAEYKAGYDRYEATKRLLAATVGEADLGGGTLGPEISVGLVNYTKSDLTNSSFNIRAYSASTGNALDYIIKDKNGTVLATVAATAPITQTKVRYATNETFRIYDSIAPEIITPSEVNFEAANPSDAADIVFNFNRPSSEMDDYRGKIRLRYYNDGNSKTDDTIWAINILPLEQYVWGMGEIMGTGPAEHNKVMTTVFRTYGYWKLKFSTKYAGEGFKVNATPGNQLYYGYAWEKDHPNIKIGAEATRSNLVMYFNGSINEIALTPYSSWTDGHTRSFQERWGSDDYPWCQSVSDPYGKHPSLSTSALEQAGNHMVGLSAHGSLSLAESRNWTYILSYYFRNINLHSAY